MHNPVTSIDYLLAIVRNEIKGAFPFYGHGEYISSGAVTNHIIWPDGDIYIPSAGGVNPSIVSTSAQDASGGTGITDVKIFYLDSSYNQHVESKTLTGLTPVIMDATNVMFINCIHATAVGSNGSSVGTITVSFSANTMAQIKIGDTRCRSSSRMVPANKKLFIHSLVGGMVSGTASANGHIDIVATEIEGSQYDGIFFSHGEVALQDGSAVLAIPMPAGPFKTGTIVSMMGTTDKAATMTGTWYGWLENS